jgi:hypothetical protein
LEVFNLLEILAFSAAILVTLTSFSLLVIKNRRLSIVLLAVQYIGVFLLVIQTWSIQMGITKLIAGWMACAVLGLAVFGKTESGESNLETEQKIIEIPRNPKTLYSEMNSLFYFIAGVLFCLVVLSQFVALSKRFGDIGYGQAWGLLILIGMGLLILSFSARPYKSIIGLITTLSGFEILYATLDSSILTTGLLALISLGLAITGAYLVIAPTMKEHE